jgi:hypothetical protein
MEGKPMRNNRKIVAPLCSRCKEPMVWKCEQIVEWKHMQVFQCETCEKLEAVLLQSSDAA